MGAYNLSHHKKSKSEITDTKLFYLVGTKCICWPVPISLVDTRYWCIVYYIFCSKSAGSELASSEANFTQLCTSSQVVRQTWLCCTVAASCHKRLKGVTLDSGAACESESVLLPEVCATGAAAMAAAAKQRRHLGQIREHPYQRAGALSWNNSHSQWRLVSLSLYIFLYSIFCTLVKCIIFILNYLYYYIYYRWDVLLQVW